MKKIKVYGLVIIIMCMLGFSFHVHAEDNAEEVQPITEVETDDIKLRIEYYTDKILIYVAGLLGTITGLLVILSKIRKIVRDGKNTIDHSKNEAEVEKQNFISLIQQLTECLEKLGKELSLVHDVRNDLIESQASQTSINETNKSIKEVLDKLIYCFNEICSNDSQLVSSGVAKNIKEKLEGVDNNV